MIARDTLKTDTIKGLKAAILNEEVAKKCRDTGLAESDIEQIILREIKKRDEAAELFEKGGNAESAAKERAEKAILIEYAPKQIDAAELQTIVEQTITELKPDGLKDMGRVIGAVKAKVGTAGDGALIAKLVKDTLQ